MIEVFTTVTTAAADYDLIDLPTVKDELSIQPQNTKDDPFLSRAITQASSAIKNVCNRTFQVEALTDLFYIKRDAFSWLPRGRVAPLQLSRWPLLGAGTISFTGTTHGTNIIDGIATTAGLLVGQPVFGGGAPANATIASLTSTSVTLAPSSIALSAASGVAFTAGLLVVQTNDLGVSTTLVQDTDFKLNPDLGQLFRLGDTSTANGFNIIAQHWEFLPLTVIYAAGYEEIPDDLQEITLRLVTARYKARARDPAMTSRTQPGLGTENYWMGAAPGQHGMLPPEINDHLVETYRVPKV